MASRFAVTAPLGFKLPFARTGRIWPYLGDAYHPVVLLDYTPTRGRDGPAKFLDGYKGYLRADAYCVYDAFFKGARGLTEVACMMHARRYFFKALDSEKHSRRREFRQYWNGGGSSAACTNGAGPAPSLSPGDVGNIFPWRSNCTR